MRYAAILFIIFSPLVMAEWKKNSYEYQGNQYQTLENTTNHHSDTHNSTFYLGCFTVGFGLMLQDDHLDFGDESKKITLEHNFIKRGSMHRIQKENKGRFKWIWLPEKKALFLNNIQAFMIFMEDAANNERFDLFIEQNGERDRYFVRTGGIEYQFGLDTKWKCQTEKGTQSVWINRSKR